MHILEGTFRVYMLNWDKSPILSDHSLLVGTYECEDRAQLK